MSSTIHVPGGGDLQQAIEEAQPGDIITLAPGKIYTGNFKLLKKTGNQFITITTSDPSTLPAANRRITPQAASMLPKIVSPGGEPAIATEPGAHHYRLTGLEIRSAPSVYSLGLVVLGSASATSAADSASDLELDRLYIHGDLKVGAKRGVTLNSQSTVVRNCHISDIKSTSQETQAIAGWNGAGPFGIFNNYLEAAGQSIIFGGAVANIQGLVPSDIVIRNNHLKKPLSWKQGDPQYAGTAWLVRSLLQLTNAKRVLVEGNIIENNWAGVEMGIAVVFKVSAHNGDLPWAVVEDVDFMRNLVRHTGSAFHIAGGKSNLGVTRRVRIKDNLFYDIDPVKWGGEGRIFQVREAAQLVAIDHNTVIHNGPNALFFSGTPSPDFVYTNNIAPHGTEGVSGDGTGTGNATLNQYAPKSVFLKNALAGGESNLYPAGNFFPASLAKVGFVDAATQDYRLAASSPYKAAGTDAKDLGADINAVMTATRGVDDPTIAIKSPPTADSVSPSSGSGLTQTFGLVYSDPNGYEEIASAHVLFNNSVSLANGCYVRYLVSTKSLWLRDDSGTAWLGPVVMGSGGGLSNSQCTLHAGNSSVEGAGATLTLEVSLTFSSAFNGAKTIFMQAVDEGGLSSGWQVRGTWAPSGNPPPPPPKNKRDLAFEHHFIDSALPGATWGQMAIADLDKDGKPDVVIGQRASNTSSSLYWYKNTGKAKTWGKRMLLGSNGTSDCGMYPADIDGDGWIDIVSTGVWYRNPRSPTAGKVFERIVYDSSMATVAKSTHDIIAADLNGDGKVEVITHGGATVHNGLYLYRIGSDPRAAWERTKLDEVRNNHGALMPNGIGDINGDGFLDIVYIDRWFENVGGQAKKWVTHENIPFGRPGPWGMAVRTWLVDMDKDGHLDIVQSESDVAKARIAWFRNEKGDGSQWREMRLPDRTDPGDYHSLVVADFDNDKDFDVYADEMEHINVPSGREGEFGMHLWENLDGQGGKWMKRTIVTGLGGHQALPVDLDADGDVDIVTKAYTAAGTNANGGRVHVSVLENVSTVFRPLFNETNLSGWHVNPEPIPGQGTGGRWAVENGVIAGFQNPPGNGGILLTDEQFGDFEVILEVLPDRGVNSGLYLRSTEDGKAYQAMIDYHENGNVGEIYRERLDAQGSRSFNLVGGYSGFKLVAIKAVAAPRPQAQPLIHLADFGTLIWKLNGWNEVRARVVGNPPTIDTWVNGHQITHYVSEKKFEGILGETGAIALQVHGGKQFPSTAGVRFRNIRVRNVQ
jgi:hypothetical protein